MQRFHWPIGLVAILAICGLFVAVSCDQEGAGSVDETESPVEQIEPTEEPEAFVEPTDGDIRNALRSELLIDESVPSHLIDVEVSAGVVTLSGSVDNLLAKERAVRRAQMIRGVRSVIDQITVSPVIREDEDIENDVIQALALDPTTDSYELEVDVDGAEVVLDGEVDSWQERNLAAFVASGVRGVRAIDNQITIDLDEPRSDAEIQTDVEGAVERNRWVDEDLIDVSVRDRNVTLTGTVGSAEARRRAQEVAWVRGARSVNVDDVDVEPWAGGELRRDPEPVRVIPDSEIEQALQDAYVFDPRVYSFVPEIDVDNGVVTLTGTVDSVAAKRAAEETAMNTVGVWRVRNYLQVRPSREVDDATLEQDVRDAIDWNPYIEQHEIFVEATNGRIQLYGTVDNEFERDEASRVVANVSGVAEVDNYLDIYEGEEEYVEDWALLDDIRDQLFWDPWVVSSNVILAVDDGTVTISGTVEDWEAYRAAIRNAYEAGARHVISRLDISRNGPEALTEEEGEGEQRAEQPGEGS